ncbi:kinase suppressor of Ras 2 [Serendipita sp. 399]|nr:kinase suppressor of Ras 2 [Serendipita sp. 399]
MTNIATEFTDVSEDIQRLALEPVFDGTYSKVYKGICYGRTWCVNGDAARFLQQHGPTLSLDDRVTLWEGIVKGVNYLHNLNPVIIHGDLKPANVLLDANRNPRICDFGLARLILEEGGSGMTTTTAHTGTERYLAYELVASDDITMPTVESDIYALGCVGLDVIFLRIPYSHRKNNARGHIFHDIRQGIPPSVYPEDLDDIEEDYWMILSSCWPRNPLERPGTIELLSAIQAAMGRGSPRDIGALILSNAGESNFLLQRTKQSNSWIKFDRFTDDMPNDFHPTVVEDHTRRSIAQTNSCADSVGNFPTYDIMDIELERNGHIDGEISPARLPTSGSLTLDVLSLPTESPYRAEQVQFEQNGPPRQYDRSLGQDPSSTSLPSTLTTATRRNHSHPHEPDQAHNATTLDTLDGLSTSDTSPAYAPPPHSHPNAADIAAALAQFAPEFRQAMIAFLRDHPIVVQWSSTYRRTSKNIDVTTMLHSCSVCCWPEANLTLLLLHVQMHGPFQLETQPKQCTHCGVWFADEAELKKHQDYDLYSESEMVNIDTSDLSGLTPSAVSIHRLEPPLASLYEHRSGNNPGARKRMLEWLASERREGFPGLVIRRNQKMVTTGKPFRKNRGVDMSIISSVIISGYLDFNARVDDDLMRHRRGCPASSSRLTAHRLAESAQQGGAELGQVESDEHSDTESAGLGEQKLVAREAEMMNMWDDIGLPLPQRADSTLVSGQSMGRRAGPQPRVSQAQAQAQLAQVQSLPLYPSQALLPLHPVPLQSLQSSSFLHGGRRMPSDELFLAHSPLDSPTASSPVDAQQDLVSDSSVPQSTVEQLDVLLWTNHLDISELYMNWESMLEGQMATGRSGVEISIVSSAAP